MRIACISTSQVPSQTANSIQLMKACAALAGLGHEVALWVPRPSGPAGWETMSIPRLVDRADWRRLSAHYGIRHRFEIIWLRRLRPLRGYDFCARAVLAGRGWGAQLHYVWPYQAAALASWLGLPTLQEMHDLPAGRAGPILFRAFLGGRGARRALVTTEALRLALAERYGKRLQPPFTQLAPNGVDLERYSDLPSPREARSESAFPEAFTAGYTGHFYAGRGLPLMLELARRMPNVRFLWVGGEQEAVRQWRARLAREGVENVIVGGFVPNHELPMIQAACDALLMPYERRIAVSSGGDTAATASPMKVFEYLAAGRAILSSDLPVIREVLNERNAVLLPPGDVDAWEAALRRLMKYPERRAFLGEQARQDAQRYSWIERARCALEGLPA